MAQFEMISGEFIRGYTRAIQDVQEIFDYVQNDLKYHHKKLNAKLVKELLKVILKNRANIREETDGFIRWNNKKQCFEWFCKDGD